MAEVQKKIDVQDIWRPPSGEQADSLRSKQNVQSKVNSSYNTAAGPFEV